MPNTTIQHQLPTSNGWQFTVTVKSTTTTTHQVTLDKQTWQELTNKQIAPAKLIIQSFNFLLARESNQSILRSFDITDIGHYFPDYFATIKKQITR